MLRRRIFSGAMASVMALSSVAVVASAEETQVKSKADLEKLVNETYGDKFRTDDLSEYGSYSAEVVLDALEAADAILYDAESDAEDYTVAYMMVEAAVARLVIHTAEELQALIDDSKAIYETDNIMNEELQDTIYGEDGFEEFCGAYEDALDYVTSSSSVDITEAYDLLSAKKDALTPKDKVTKSEFRSMMRKYEALVAAEHAYESWRRGTISEPSLTNWNGWALPRNTKKAAYGLIWEAATACQGTINAAYEALDEIKSLSKTTDDTIVNGYKLAKDAIAVFNCWSVDSSTRATKSGVNALLKEYHNDLVNDYALTSADTLYKAVAAKVSGFNEEKCSMADGNPWVAVEGYGWVESWNWGGAGGRSVPVNPVWNVNTKDTVYVAVDADGYAVFDGADYTVTTDNTEALPTDAAKWQKISKNTNFDLLKLVKVTADMVTDAKDLVAADNTTLDGDAEWPTAALNVTLDGVDAAVINMSDAYGLAMDYLAGNAAGSIINDVDTTGVIADEVKANSKEWALVYRYLNYALSDKYDATYSEVNYSKADVKALIEKAYDLADLTGDAAIFSELHMALVEARQDANAWVKDANADKMYKDSSTAYAFGDEGDKTSTGAYEILNGAYTALEKAYNGMKYSFGDVYSKLAEVAGMIDDGELEATDALLKAMDDTAYALSVVADEIATSNGEYDENPAFDVDRVLQADNRIITCTDQYNPVTISTEIGSVYCTDSHNASHFNLVQAYGALLGNVAKQTATPAAKAGDVDGNGTVNALDAAALLTAIVDGTTLDAAVADYDKSGAVNALDAAAILEAIVNG